MGIRSALDLANLLGQDGVVPRLGGTDPSEFRQTRLIHRRASRDSPVGTWPAWTNPTLLRRRAQPPARNAARPPGKPGRPRAPESRSARALASGAASQFSVVLVSRSRVPRATGAARRSTPRSESLGSLARRLALTCTHRMRRRFVLQYVCRVYPQESCVVHVDSPKCTLSTPMCADQGALYDHATIVPGSGCASGSRITSLPQSITPVGEGSGGREDEKPICAWSRVRGAQPGPASNFVRCRRFVVRGALVVRFVTGELLVARPSALLRDVFTAYAERACDARGLTRRRALVHKKVLLCTVIRRIPPVSRVILSRRDRRRRRRGGSRVRRRCPSIRCGRVP